MSDADSEDSDMESMLDQVAESLRSQALDSAVSISSRPRGELPADFPLSAQSIVRHPQVDYSAAIDQLIQEVRAELAARDERSPSPHQGREAEQASRMAENTLEPIVTVTSALSATTYREENDDTPRTLEYVAVQRALLKWLMTKPSDALTAERAYEWTLEIDAEKQPKAQDALRLCYYMHSQGFDVYSKFHGGDIALYIVNQRSHERSQETDILYWRQNFTTHEQIIAIEDQRDTRRNALAELLPTADGLRSTRSAAPPPSGGPEASQSVAARLQVARARLEVLLSQVTQDADEVEAAIMEIARITEQQFTEQQSQS